MLFIALFTYNPNDIVFKKVPCTKKIEYEIKLMYNIKLLKKDGDKNDETRYYSIG